MSNFYNEVFVRELKDSDDPNAMMATGGRRATAASSRSAAGLFSRASGAEPQAR